MTWVPNPPIDPFLQGDHDLMLARQAAHQILVDRLGEAGIGNGGRQTPGSEILGRRQSVVQARSVGQDRNLAPLAHDAALADLQRRAARRHLDQAVASPRG